MRHKNEKPEPARVSGSRSHHSTPSNFPTPASISKRYGTGWPAYEAAKSAWLDANPGADSRQIEAAMRRIARAVRV